MCVCVYIYIYIYIYIHINIQIYFCPHIYTFPSKSTYLCELTFTMQQTISQLTYLKHSLALMIWWISLEVVLTQLKMGGLEWAYSHVWAPSGMAVMLRVSRKRGKPKCTSLFQAPTCVRYAIISLASKSCGQTQSQYRGDRPLRKTAKKITHQAVKSGYTWEMEIMEDEEGFFTSLHTNMLFLLLLFTMTIY